MTIYKELTKENYKQYEKDYLALKEERICSLISKMIKAGFSEKELNFSPESLKLVNSYLNENYVFTKTTTKPKLEDLPLWVFIENVDGNYIDSGSHYRYSIESLFLLDEIAYYLGEIFIRVNGYYWGVNINSRPNVEYMYQTVILGGKYWKVINPIEMVINTTKNHYFSEHPETKQYYNEYGDLYSQYYLRLTPFEYVMEHKKPIFPE